MPTLDTSTTLGDTEDRDDVIHSGSPILPLQATGLSFHVGEHKLIDDITLTLGGGKVSMVMGSNGAGKTLLLRLLHGLQNPSGGEVRWGGLPTSPSIRKRQAMVFQKAVLLRRSVNANMDFVLSLQGRVDPDQRDRILEQVDLLDHGKQPARLLSGGEQQRLALARTLATNPDILFLDEPTASLDPASVLKIEDIVLAAHKRGIKIVFVTHDIGQARRLADEIIFLHRGRLQEQTSAEQFFTNPASESAKAYLEGRILV